MSIVESKFHFLNQLKSFLSFSNGNCDVCGVLTDDFEKHFQLHLVKVEDKLEVKVEVNVEEKVALDEAKEFNDNDSGFENDLKQADEISDADVNDLLKDLLVDVWNLLDGSLAVNA